MITILLQAPFLSIRWLADHMANVHYGQYPIIHDTDRKPRSISVFNMVINPRYIVASIGSAILLLDLLIVVIDNDFRLGDDPRVFYRVITRIWPSTLEQRDIVTVGAYIIIPWYYFYLLVDRFQQVPVLMVLNKVTQTITCQGRKLQPALESRILHKHRKLYSKLNILRPMVIINVSFVFAVPFILGEIFAPNEMSGSPRLIIMIIAAPINAFYLGLIIDGSVYFYVTCIFIHIKQTFFTERLFRLIRMASNCRWRSTRYRLKTFAIYRTVVENVMNLTKEIKLYNRYWCPYISVILLVYTMDVVFITFNLITTKTLKEFAIMIPLLSFGTNYLIYIYLISWYCSKTIFQNVRIHKRMKMFQVRMRRWRKLNSGHQLEIHKMDTWESFQTFFQKSSFKLINGYTINSKLFEVIAGFILFASLKTFGDVLTKMINRAF